MKLFFFKVLMGITLLIIVVGCEKKRVLQTVSIKVASLSQIVIIKDSLVKPIIYSEVSGLEKLPISDLKKTFISIILPAVLIAKHQLAEDQGKIHELKSKKRWTKADSTYYHDFKIQYKASDVENLLKRMTAVPNSIVLAQAAVESGWGQSRFFREGNNVFGIWSYNRDEPRLRASVKRPNATVHVRAYKDISHSILDYFKTLGKVRAYRDLRSALEETSDPFELLPYLKYYSERRLSYVEQLRKVIEQNDLTQYDHYSIDPTYLVEL